MAGRLTLRNYLVKKLQISNKEASKMIAEAMVFVNEKPGSVHQLIRNTDKVTVSGEVIQVPKELVYYLFYKPRGIETTQNADIESNLYTVLSLEEDIFPAGRLDKESEGLLLLTNDGQLYESLVHNKRNQEKEYVVQVNKRISSEFIQQMSEGIEIMGKRTRPAKTWLIDDFTFGIILTEGMNRQIRRMCYKLNVEVTSLKRIRIVNLNLREMQTGEFRMLSENELKELKQIINYPQE